MTKEALQCRMLSTALLWVFEGGNGEGAFCQDLAFPGLAFMTIFYWGWQITIWVCFSFILDASLLYIT